VTAALITSIIFNIVLVVALCFLAVIVHRMLQTAVSVTDRVHDRSQETLKDVLDRLMAVDFVEYHDARQERETEDGEFILPDGPPPPDGEVIDQRNMEELRQDAEEMRLLTEDFPEREPA